MMIAIKGKGYKNAMLGKVRIACERDSETTAVSNTFIDNLMSDANEAQIKTYLYLLRAMQSGHATTVSEIADAFNHTEREVKRALAYWEERGLVRLEYDNAKRLTQIALEDPASESAPVVLRPSPGQHMSYPEDTPRRRKYSSDEVKRFTADESLSITLFAAEKYFKRALNPTEIQTILYIYEDLAFPADLLDYLLQYTAENAKSRYASYMEKTAIAWHREGIRTHADAIKHRGKKDKRIFEVMRALGLSGEPSPFETEYFRKWFDEYAFPMDMIREACRKTVFSTQSHRVEYADGILKSWKKQGISTMEDIEKNDTAHLQIVSSKKRVRGGTKSESAPDTRNRFNRMQTQEYDFDALRKSVVSNQ